MSKQGMIGMDVAAQEMLGVGETLTDEQWQLPSGAEGWSVKDVVAHAGCLMAYLMVAVGGAAVPDIGIEELNEVQVAQKRGLDEPRPWPSCGASWQQPWGPSRPCRKSRRRRPLHHSKT